MATPDAGAHGPRRVAGDDAGVALVEFALLLPFLAILVFGTIDLARAYALKNRLTNAAREGAFVAQYDPGFVDGCAGELSIREAVLREDAGLGSLKDFTVTVSKRTGSSSPSPLPPGCSSTSASDASDVIVSASSNMTILTPLVGAITGPEVKVSGSVEMAVLR